MGLKDLVIPTVEVQLGTGSFSVRGLSSADIEILMRLHGNDFKALWDEFLEDGTDLTKLEVNALFPLLKKVVSRLPAAFIDVIAHAADADEDERVIIKKLPISVQVQAVGAVIGATLGGDGDWAKMLETAIQMLGGANGAVGQLLQNQAKG